MKKTFVLAIMLLLFAGLSAIAQEDYEYDETVPADDVPIKSIMLDLGHTLNGSGLCFGGGFKYWNVGVTFGLAGLAPDRPNYDRHSVQPEQITEKKNFKALMINIDAHYYFNLEMFEPLTVFASVGYYSQSDSTIARTISDENRGVYDLWYLVAGTEGHNSESGICFGAGVQYPVSDNIALGIALHSRKGIYAQFEYYWY